MTGPAGPAPQQPADPNDVMPFPVQFGVGLTAPNRDGVQWAILEGNDGTCRVAFRMPWQFAPQIGQSIAAALAAVAQQAEQNSTSGLIVPQGAGSLIVPGGVRVNGGGPNGH